MDLRRALDEIETRYEEVSAELSAPAAAGDHERLKTLGKELAELSEIVTPYREYTAALAQAEEARALAKDEADPEMAAYLRDEADAADGRALELRGRLEELLVPKDPNDDRNVVVEIRAGAGGQEAALWAGELFELYRAYAERHRWRTETLSASPSDLGGFKEVVLEVRGKGAFSRLKHESGVHRVQRVPVTESQGRIHTSAAGVLVLPEAEEFDVQIDPNELRIDVFRSSGPGGQSVNTTDSAVRITHLPTGIVVSMQNEKSQLQNREAALRVLRARLLAMAQDEADREAADARRSQVRTVDRSERVRTYNFPENRISDHRVGYKAYNLDQVLDGDLDAVVDALTRADTEALLAGERE